MSYELLYTFSIVMIAIFSFFMVISAGITFIDNQTLWPYPIIFLVIAVAFACLGAKSHHEIEKIKPDYFVSESEIKQQAVEFGYAHYKDYKFIWNKPVEQETKK